MKKNRLIGLTVIFALSTGAGLAVSRTNVHADTTNQVATAQQLSDNVELYSNNLAQVKAAQQVNFPTGYNLTSLANVNAGNDGSFDQMAKQGMTINNYQSDPVAAKQSVDINHLTDAQTEEMNQYALSLVNNARAHFGRPSFSQNQGTILAVKGMAQQYQAKGESLMNGQSHDQSIIQGRSENIATQQIYTDHINGLAPIPFAQLRGSQLANTNSIPLANVTNMDDLRALVYYGVMGMLFNDGQENYGHAKNFLTATQVVNNMAVYPSVTPFTGQGETTNADGTTTPFNFRGENVDLHFIWDNGSGHSQTEPSQPAVDNGNYGWLDQINLNSDGQLTVSGWHATNQSQGRPYHFIIALDQNNHELGRVNVSNEAVSRPDVERVHNVEGALNSGFNTTLNIGSRLDGVTAIKVLSRYTTDPAGNDNYVDYWYNDKRLRVNAGNYGWFDGWRVVGNQLELTGWQATNQAADRPYHYVIVLVNGREVARQLVQPVTRNDVAKAYPGVYQAAKSGFDVKFDLSKIDFNQHVQFLSRYTNDPAGNGSYIDYWFNLTNGHPVNNGWLDNFAVSGNQLNISGWHATDTAPFESHHFIILWDATAGRQAGSWQVGTVARPDVARAYPQIADAGRSGFSYSINLSSIHLLSGHTYQVVSRYSTDGTGNGNGNGHQYTDYWFAGKELLQ